MNRIKSVYVNIVVFAPLVFLGHAAAKAVSGNFSLAWVGVVLASGAILGFFGWVFSGRVPRTSRDVPAVLFMVLAGVVVALLGAVLSPADERLAVLYSALTAGLWLGYDFWYSRLPNRSQAVLVAGRPLPEIALQDVDGKAVDAGAFRGAPALLVFYRGNWCPFCMAQIREIAAQYRQLAARGITVAFISPQPAAKSQTLAEKFNIPALFLVDAGNRAARALGIAHEHGLPAGLRAFGYASETVMPTVILTDAAGTILHVDLTENYRVRPEPSVFLRQFERSAEQ